MEGTIVHFGHKQHPLAFRDEAENEEQKLYTCSICELPMLSSPSYTCTSSKDCKFLVHKPCAQLPYQLINPPHHLVANSRLSLEPNPRAGGPHNCRICRKPCRNFTYTNDIDEIDLHPLCARPVEIKIKHESHNEHPLVAICRETLSLCNACGDEHYGHFFFCQECNFWIHRDCALLRSIVKHVSHSHHLILTYALFKYYRHTDCGICGRKLLGKGFYSCVQCNTYATHISCATSNMENLTSGLEVIIHMPDEGTSFPSLIIRILERKKRIDDDKDRCGLCNRPCNGFFYCYDDFMLMLDLECTSAPKTIMHASHGQHVLSKELNRNRTPAQPAVCCSDNTRRGSYRCVSCDFWIHVGCALLPKKASHKFDKHHLELSFYFKNWVERECCFCEFCEEDIDQRYWFYHCADCDQSFHIKCIPSVGLLSKVKFGGTLHVPCHPRHPVALTRMLMESNQRCGYCKGIIPGFVDDMAFYCSDCEFWIHFRCARDCCVVNDSEFGLRLLWYKSTSEFGSYSIY
ncbi:hypothetical protein PHJA_001888700 [Phtheirospermum japonicum]|uniref:Phorbol-ester/DAG-type domain-containing protein n=1 Tax=Phtheirospermum japonicum TaxID=374723 RepID=A0A830CE10_9LAMI|nr:hypothetical protein PHJA_001888700 [Phtheirospermum japonicum]